MRGFRGRKGIGGDCKRGRSISELTRRDLSRKSWENFRSREGKLSRKRGKRGKEGHFGGREINEKRGKVKS